MKKIFLQMVSMSAIALSVNAQVQMGSQVSYLTGHGNNDNHTTLIGATVYGSFAITDKMSVGSVIHAYAPKKSNYNSGGISYSATDDVTNISAAYEMLLGKSGSAIQPYIGIDMGISSSNHNISYINGQNKKMTHYIKQTYVMMSPKAGFNIALSSMFGLYSQIQYNYSPGDGGPQKIKLTGAKGSTTITTEPISKYYNIDTGVYLLIGNIKKML
jgi:hypothetical protein